MDKGILPDGGNSSESSTNEVINAIVDERIDQEKTFKIYKRRWLMLFIVFFLNVSNGALWISFATIAGPTADYFKVSTDAVNWFSLVFFITTIPFMFVAMWVIDRYGFRPGVLFGCFFNSAGSLLRLLGTFDFVPKGSQYAVVLAGQTLASLAQPFAMSLPTKVSELWFPQSQRTFSTALCAMGNPLGFMVGSFVAPIIVSDAKDVPIPNEIFSAMGILAGLFGLLVRHSKPPMPPSNTADKPDVVSADYSYLNSLKKVLMNKSFVVLMLAVGGGMGLVSGLQTMMDQMLCSWGYEDNFAGLCCALMVIGGFVGAGVFSYVAERTKLYEQLINVVFAITVVFAIVFVMIFHIRNIEYIIAIITTVMGFLAVGIYPICLEIGVETTYPIDESISAGAIVVMGQILGTVFVLVMEALQMPMSTTDVKYEKCGSDTTEPANMIWAGIFVVAVAAVLSILLLVCFRPQYKRTEAEVIKRNLTTAQSVSTIESQETNAPNTLTGITLAHNI